MCNRCIGLNEESTVISCTEVKKEHFLVNNSYWMYSFTNQPVTFLAVEYAERLVLFFTAVRLAGQTLYGSIQELMLYFS